MKNRNVKVIDDHNIDRNANVMFALDLEGSEYVVYWIERDEESNNVFVSKVLKNLDGTSSMINIDDEEKKKEVAEMVKILISTSVSDQNDKLIGTSMALPNGKTIKFVDVVFNKEQNIDVSKTYITTVKKEVTRVAEKYYDIVVEEVKVADVLSAVTPAPVAPAVETIPVVPTPVVVAQPQVVVADPASVAQSVAPAVEPVVQAVTPVPVVPAVEPTPVVPTPVVATQPQVVVADPASVVQSVAPVVEPVVQVVTPVSVVPAVEPTPVVPTPVVAAQPQVVVADPASVAQSVAPVVEPVVQVVTPVPVVPAVEPTPVVPTPVVQTTTVAEARVSEPTQGLVFNAAKETNLNAALGEVASSTTIPVENIESVREFGVDTPVAQPVNEQPVVATMTAPVTASEPKVLTKKAGFANSQFFMVVAIAFFMASCIFLGYEVYQYFQLV